MTLPCRRVLPVFLLVLAAGRWSAAQEWTRFRGPNGSGISDAKTVPLRWSADDYNWEIRLPGRGHSSPVVWGRKLFVTSADVDKRERYLLCIDTADGSRPWQRGFAFQKYKIPANGSHASNTAAVDAEHVYVLWQSPQGSSLNALDHSGRPVWQVDMGPYKSGHGTGSSPIVFEEMVIVCNDHDATSFLIAVDSHTGKVRWKIDRTGQRACYSTPCVYRVQGRRPEIIFTHSYQGITGVDAATGRKNWEIRPFGTFKQRAVASPIVTGDLVLGSSGFTTSEKNVVAVRPRDTAAGVTVEEVYRVSKSASHVPTPLIYNGRMFLWADNGIVTCVKSDTGQHVWQKRVGGNYHGSPICVGGRLYCVDRNGTVVVLAAGDRYELLARNELGKPSRATPAVSGGVLFLRTYSHLISLGGKKMKAANVPEVDQSTFDANTARAGRFRAAPLVRRQDFGLRAN